MKYSNADRGGQVYSNLTDHSPDRPSEKWTAYLIFCCLVAALASFQFGYNIGVVNLPEKHVTAFYEKSFIPSSNGELTTTVASALAQSVDTEKASASSPDSVQPDQPTTEANTQPEKSPLKEKVQFLWVVTVCLFIVGGMVGAFSAKFVLDFFGRRNAIIVHNLFTVIGSGLVIAAMYVPHGYIYVMLSRAFYGIQGGMSCSLIPTYLNEISPNKLRGATGVIHQLFITLGIVISQLLGFRQLFGTDKAWHFLLAGPVVPCVLCMVLLGLFCPETPRALLSKKGGDEKAKEALIRLRGSNNVAEEIDEITVELQDSEDEAISMVQLFTNAEYRWPLIIGLVLQLTQQFCGINAVFFYSGSIFKNANVHDDQIQYAVLLTGVINVIMTIIVVPLIDRLGRKPLLVFPMIVIIIDFIALTCFLELSDKSSLFPYLSIVCVIIFIMCFALGLGPVPFIFCAEVFRTEAKSSALSVCMFTNWTANLILSLFFPYLNKLIGGYVFIVFLVIVAMSLLLIVFKMPETKGRKIDEILDEFAGKSRRGGAAGQYNQYNRNENILMGNVRA